MSPTIAQSTLNRRKAFTILELMAVVVILGILAVIVVPRVGESTATAKKSVNQRNIAAINEAVEQFALANGRLPDNIDEVDTVDYFPDGIPSDPISNSPYSLDPVTKRAVSVSGG